MIHKTITKEQIDFIMEDLKKTIPLRDRYNSESGVRFFANITKRNNTYKNMTDTMSPSQSNLDSLGVALGLHRGCSVPNS